MSLKTPEPSSARKMVHAFVVLLGAVAFTLMCFLILPITQVIAKKVDADLEVRQASIAEVPPPPPPPEPEPEREEEPKEQPPELAEEAPPLDLSQIELALNPGAGGGWATGDFGIRLNTQVLAGDDKGVDALFSINDLDQKPRAVYQPSPQRDAKLRKRGAGTVNILFVVDQRGRVENPLVQSSTDAVFEPSALAAVKQWRFQPGKRAGQPVRFRMRVPITFPDK